jgi:hypothetical protein
MTVARPRLIVQRRGGKRFLAFLTTEHVIFITYNLKYKIEKETDISHVEAHHNAILIPSGHSHASPGPASAARILYESWAVAHQS